MSSKYQEYQIESPILGVFKDISSADIPARGWKEMDNFHVRHARIEKYPGWSLFHPFDFEGSLIYGFDFEKLDGSRFLILGTANRLFLYDRATNSFSVLEDGFPGSVVERWQSAVMNDKLYITRRNISIREFVEPGTFGLLVGDVAMPEGASFITNIVNHLMVANTTEGGNLFRQRVRWSDIDDPTVWVSAPDNEANFLDLQEQGEITGIAPLGTNAVVAYTQRAIYLLSYVGLPIIFTVERRLVHEGLFAPYSLVYLADRHFFLGNNDFYMFDGTSITPLGSGRVINFLKNDIQLDSPKSVYGFAHPFDNEVYWVYRSKGSLTGNFDKAIIYNWEYDAWSTRSHFPHSMMVAFLRTTERTIDQVTTPWTEAVGTWRDKQGRGVWVLLSGD